MALKDAVEMIELLTFGYLREFENDHQLSHKLPNELKKIIVIFYPRDKWKFIHPKESKQNSYKIEDGGNKLIKESTRWLTVQIGDFIDVNDKVTIHSN